MKTPTEVFDDACLNRWKDGGGRGFGRRLHPVPVQEFNTFHSIGHWAKMFERGVRAWGPGLVPVYFDCIANGQVNAIADLIDGGGYIGLFHGSIILLFDMFYRMLSHPNVLPQIGNSGVEIIRPEHADGLEKDLYDLQESRFLNGQPPLASQPNDPVRRAFADFSAHVAFGFLFLHEINHIARGHLHYLQKDCGLPFILEANQVLVKPADMLTLQALEWDADFHAAASSLHNILVRFSHPEQFPISQNLKPILKTPEDGLFLWAFAISGLFHLWGLKIDPHDLDRDHPPTALRWLHLGEHCQPPIKTLAPTLAGKVAETMSEATRNVVVGILAIGGDIGAEEKAAFAGLADGRSRQHIPTVRKRLTEIEPALNKYGVFKPVKGQWPNVD